SLRTFSKGFILLFLLLLFTFKPYHGLALCATQVQSLDREVHDTYAVAREHVTDFPEPYPCLSDLHLTIVVQVMVLLCSLFFLKSMLDLALKILEENHRGFLNHPKYHVLSHWLLLL
uniref:Uncharacterized protein n=1 Tax=Varanus komodoensis TaxID=61221 RepID=A0A8D2LX55_VARKO